LKLLHQNTNFIIKKAAVLCQLARARGAISDRHDRHRVLPLSAQFKLS
jgi:hypothetical protein